MNLSQRSMSGGIIKERGSVGRIKIGRGNKRPEHNVHQCPQDSTISGYSQHLGWGQTSAQNATVATLVVTSVVEIYRTQWNPNTRHRRPFVDGRHKVHCNGRILCGRVAPA